MGEWMYRSIIPDLSTNWRWVISFTPLPLYPRERPSSTHWIGGWVSPKTGLDDVERRKIMLLARLELRPLGHPARSPSLYRLHYPGSLVTIYIILITVLSLRYKLVVCTCTGVEGYTHTHTNTYKYIYTHIYVCVCVCVEFSGETWWKVTIETDRTEMGHM
jgi:hypothetical protein